MSISPASPPSTRPSLSISSPQKLRFQENKQAIETLEKQISKEIKGSYAFTGGRQARDERFQKLFTDFFRELRGPEPLVDETAQAMADRFIERPDISYSYTPCGNPFQTLYEPIPELALALESIIEKEYGLQDQFLEALASNEKKLSGLDLKDRDTQYRTYYVVCRLFPTCLGTLRAIFKDLLIVEWLRQDSGQYRLVRVDNEAIALLWQEAKQSAEQQKAYDVKLSERHWRDFKTDLYQTASSGALSLATKKPQFVASQVAKLGMNVIGRQVDPHGQSKVLKGFSLLSSALVSKRLGGNTGDLVKSLGVDVAELWQRPENTSKEKALLRGYGSALLKGALSLDTKKLTAQLLGAVASTGADILPKADKVQSFKSEVHRALRATLTNSDMHGCLIDKGVERYFKEPEKPTPQVEELAQVEESKEQFDGQWLEDVFNEKLSHVAVEEPKPLLPPPVHIEPQVLNLSLSMESRNSHVEKHDKEYLIYSHNSQGNKRQIGKFSSRDLAQTFFNKTNDYISRINRQNQEIAQAQSHYYSQGMNPKDVAKLKPIDPIYVEISACGYKSKVYQGDQKIFGKTGQDGTNDAITKAKGLMDNHLAGNDQAIHAFKTEMADKIFKSSDIPHHVKQSEADRIIKDQKQNIHELNQTKATHRNIDNVIPKAKDKVEKRQDDADDAWWISGKREGRLQDAQNALKQLRVDQATNKDTAGQIEKRIEDNNFILQIAQGNTTQEEVNGVKQALKEKEIAKQVAGEKVESKNEKFQKSKKDKDHKGTKRATDQFNQASQEQANAHNRYYELQGLDHRVEPDPKIKAPKKASKWEKAKAWVSNNVSASGEINALTISGPHTQVPPSLIHVRTQSPERERPTYAEMQHQINVQRSELTQMETTQSQSRGNWGEVQNFQNQQIFQENMSFRSAQQAQGTAQHEISQHSANMGVLWDNGVARNVQSPPVSTRQAIQSGIREATTTRPNPIMEMSGVAPFVLSKVIPKRTQEKVKTWVKDYIQEIKNDPLQARKDLDVAVILGAKKAVVIAIQAFEQPSLKKRPNTLGLMEASNRFDRWVAGKVNVNLDSRNAQIGMFVGEIFAPMGMCKTARPVMKVGQEAIQFIRSTQRARPLVDRVLLSPDTFGRELRAIQGMQQQAYRGGLVGEGTVARLAERNVRVIQPMKLPYLKKGVDYEWFAKYSPRIDHLKRMTTNPKHFYRSVRKEFTAQNLNELQIRRVLNYSGFNTYPRPLGLPNNVVVEFSKENGGMIYRLAGSKNKENLVVRVCPGLAKESIPSAYMSGGIKNGSLRQQTTYVVQSRGNLTLTTQGDWVNLSLEENRWKQALAHIPLETYEFKGW